MKTLKKILIWLGIIIVLLIVISFFLPSKMLMERDIIIKSPPTVVYDQINILKNWEKWSPWYKMDTTAKITYSTPDSGIGAWYTWESTNKKIGKGKLSLMETKSPSLVKLRLSMMEGDSQTLSSFLLAPADSGTKVSWLFDSRIGLNPFNKYMALIMKSVLRKSFDNGLADLKRVCESHPTETQYKIELTDVKAFCYIGIRDTCSYSTISQKMGQQFGQLMEFLTKNKVIEIAPPFAIYHKFENGIFDMESAIPIDKCIKSKGNIKCSDMKEGKAVVLYYTGSYDKMDKAYRQLEEWISKNNHKISGPPWEEYITDPSKEKDPSRWLTKIYFPVE
jgi:effector-binding domain-containing protein